MQYIAKDPRIKYFRSHTNVGAASNFNKTLDLARGEYFAWAAHDDFHAPQYFAQCIKHLDHQPDAVLCYARPVFVDDKAHVIPKTSHLPDASSANLRDRFRALVSANPIVVQIFGVIRRSILIRTPGIAPYMTSDQVLLAELALYGKFIEIPDYLFFHREHTHRSVNRHANALSRTQWFDPQNRGGFVLEHWQRLAEHAKSVIRSPCKLVQKIQLLTDISRVGWWRRHLLSAELMDFIKAH
jgi:GT2 family glycosyltransferase